MKFNLLTKYFPPPKFLKARMTGLDISNTSIKYIDIEDKAHKLEVKKFGDVNLGQDIISEGDIKDKKRLTEILKKIKKEQKLNDVILSTPEKKSYVFNMSIPYVEKEELRESVELHLEENIPIPPDEIVFDFNVVSYLKKSNELIVNVKALSKKSVESYKSVLENAGMRPVVIDLDSTSLARSVIPKGDKGTYMIVDFGRDATSISIYQEGFVNFSTILDYGSNDITKAIMKDFNLDFDKAEKLKLEKGINVNEKEDKLFTSIVSSIAVLKDEIQKYYTFWNEKANKKLNHTKKIEKIYFSGGGSALLGFSDFISTYITIPLEIANPWVNIVDLEEEIPPISKKDSLKYATVIGLALYPKYYNE